MRSFPDTLAPITGAAGWNGPGARHPTRRQTPSWTIDCTVNASSPPLPNATLHLIAGGHRLPVTAADQIASRIRQVAEGHFPP